MKITKDEWLKELHSLMSPSVTTADGWMTSEEIRSATGIGDKRLHRILKAGVADGVISVEMRPRTNVIGVVIKAPCYRFRRKK